MKSEQLAVVRGWADTRATLRIWQRHPLGTVLPWLAASLAVALLLLAATWVVATLNMPGEAGWMFVGVGRAGAWGDFFFILYRNALVLSLHAMACVAGFMAGSSLPIAAAGYSGWWRRVHDRAAALAIAFVAAATLFSLGTQAYALGLDAAARAADHGISPALLLLGLLPHALPELCALFLPLAAWILASRRGAWHELLAATFVTSAIAVPVVIAAAAVEVWLTPHLLYFLK
jgi:hypothetical protein